MDRNFFGEIKKIKASELAKICGFKTHGDQDFEISGVATLKDAIKNDLSFFGNKKYLSDLKTTSAGAVIIAENAVADLPSEALGLIYPNAIIGYAKALEILCPAEEFASRIADSARIHESARIGKNVGIGENTVIEENVEIGDGVVIGCNCAVGKNCKIGAGGRVGNNVSISCAIIGEKVRINSGARIGESGFGIIPTGKEMVYVRQIGRVIIGDRVRIGANTTIDRGSIEDTVIGNDTIVDNLVQIAHNVQIGERSIIVAQVGIAGSAKIGNDVILAGQVGVAGHIEIGDRAIAAAKSGIHSNVESGKIVGGIPAVDAGVWKRQAA
ncbi:MAG: UDP-3-O-(3-hydroxymyristoyl)glucosamine N-acyltransferase, partial [Holosporaceae bacterium]|nr:UDP-3-O-(3-hydroxymyristoyl)glucosamine N-acyltransferase [Holosporaceae bacterium]